MRPSFRWFGPDDPIPLRNIAQIPGVQNIVSALYHIAVGEAWPTADVIALRETIEQAGLRLGVIESIPVHEDIKLGRPARERWADNYCRSIEALGHAEVPVLCYNFMPVFDWTRTELHAVQPDGSTALAYDDAALQRIDLSRGTGDLPGWAAAYSATELRALIEAYRSVDAERLWENLAWFLERIVPVAEASNVKLAVHPDDPPWPIFGLPRILTSGAALLRLTELVDSDCNGVTFCTGSLGADPNNDLPAIARELSSRGRIHFAHCRNVRITGDHSFTETPHPSAFGNVDMFAVLQALHENGFDGPMRPDHGRMIWNEEGRPGYGLYDRALGIMYLQGLWESLVRSTATTSAVPV